MRYTNCKENSQFLKVKIYFWKNLNHIMMSGWISLSKSLQEKKSQNINLLVIPRGTSLLPFSSTISLFLLRSIGKELSVLRFRDIYRCMLHFVNPFTFPGSTLFFLGGWKLPRGKKGREQGKFWSTDGWISYPRRRPCHPVPTSRFKTRNIERKYIKELK